jgi:hypothetical protein
MWQKHTLNCGKNIYCLFMLQVNLCKMYHGLFEVYDSILCSDIKISLISYTSKN